MDYNWIEIFKEKSTKELYDIYCGNSFLPKTVIPIAKLELEKRKFNFDDIESFKDTLKLEDVERELDDLYIELSIRPSFTVKSSIFMGSVSIISIIIFFKLLNIELYPDALLVWLIITPLMIILIIVNNYIHKRFTIKFQNLEDKKSKILEKFENRGLIEHKLKLIEELSSQSMKRLQESYRANRILGLIITIAFTIYLILKYLV
jgi:hypothetical protein